MQGTGRQATHAGWIFCPPSFVIYISRPLMFTMRHVSGNLESLQFKDPTASKVGSIAWRMHNAGLFDEFKDVTIEADPENGISSPSDSRFCPHGS